MATNPPPDLVLTPLGGEARPLQEWLTTFHLASVVLDPYTNESSWILPTAARILEGLRGSDARVNFVVTADADDTRAFMGPLVDQFLVFTDPDRIAVKALELTELPAFVFIRVDGTVQAAAEGWRPAEWRAVAEAVAEATAWRRPDIPHRRGSGPVPRLTRARLSDAVPAPDTVPLMADPAYAELLPLGPDDTPYRLVTTDGVSTFDTPAGTFLRVEPEAITRLTAEAMRDIAHYLRPAHLAQLRRVLDDPEASDNDRFVALDLLKNASIAAGGVLPMCQDTGTAIVKAKKGQFVFTGGGDEAAIAAGVQRTYLTSNLRYSQMAPLNMYDEVNTGTNLPAEIKISAVDGDTYSFLFIAKGGGSANKSYLFQETKALLNEATLLPWLFDKLQSLGTAACPPYHLAVVIGGTSAEFAVETAKLASTHYLDDLPTTGSPRGHGFRDVALEAKVLSLAQRTGIGAQFGGKYFCHDVRIIRLPRHGASCPVALAVSCSADRQAKGKITRDGVFLEQLETDPARYLPDVEEHHLDGAPAVRIDLSRPMDEIRAELSKYPVKTRVMLSGPMVVARDIAHAKIKERLDAGEPMPDYLRDHCVYYAGPAKTPEGYVSGLVRADHGGADGQLRRAVPGRRRLDGDARQGQPVTAGHRVVRRATAGSTSARSAGRRPGWRSTTSPRSRCWSIPSWAWRRSGASRSSTSRRSSSSTTRATTSSSTSAARPRRSRCRSADRGDDGRASGGGLVAARAPNSTAAKSVTPMSASAPTRSVTSAAVPTIAMSAGPVDALSVEHRPVTRQLPVDREDLRRPRPGAVDVVGDAHRERGDDAGRRAPGRLGGGVDRRDRVPCRGSRGRCTR